MLSSAVKARVLKSVLLLLGCSVNIASSSLRQDKPQLPPLDRLMGNGHQENRLRGLDRTHTYPQCTGER